MCHLHCCIVNFKSENSGRNKHGLANASVRVTSDGDADRKWLFYEGSDGCVSLLFVGAKINKLCHLVVYKFKNTARNGDVTRNLASLLRNLVVCNTNKKGGKDYD